MESHRKYWREMTDYLIESVFSGNMEEYEKYFERSIANVEPIMEKYSKQGNEFWLKSGNERAFFQTMEDKLLMNPSIYEKELSKFLGRDFKYASICSESEAVYRKNVLALRNEVLEVCKSKYPNIYKKYEALQQNKKTKSKSKITGMSQEFPELTKIIEKK